MISLDSLDIINKYPKVFNTSNEKHFLGKDFEKILATSEYKIIGFLDGYMYCSYGNYIAKDTLDGVEISRVSLECDHAAFNEELDYFYTWVDNKITKIDKNLIVDWTNEFEDDIQSISVDVYGSIYVIFENSRTIRKISNTGELIMFISDSDDITKNCKLYRVFITPGAGFLYIIGSQFYGYNDSVDSFIDIYDVKKGKRTNRQIFAHSTNVKANDSLYEYDNIILKGDYFYIYAKNYIAKINLKGILIWKYNCAYNPDTKSINSIGHIEFDDNTFEEYLYFCENNISGDKDMHTFGKISTNGTMVWYISFDNSISDSEFKMCVYQNKIYTSDKSNVQEKKSYILSLYNNSILFKTRDGKLLKIIEYNEELYSSDNYEGKRLLGHKVKDGIDKNIYVPLKYNKGHIVNGKGKAILFSQSNPNYYDSKNFEDFNLLHTESSNKGKELSILAANNYKAIRTKLGSILKTKLPYTGTEGYDILTTENGQNVVSEQDQYIVRSKYKYLFLKYLLADANKFKDYIITKEDASRIATKLYGYDIIKKTRTIYRYILSKYSDIDVVVEWLIQNDVLSSILPEYVDKLRHHTTSMIQAMQIAGVPTVYDIKPTKKFEYTFDGYKYPNQVYGTQIFTCNNLPFTKRSSEMEKIYMDSIANLVEEKKMRPFLLFLNGRAIKWTDCTIVKDWSYTYVVIRNTDVTENNLECVVFPCNIRYGEDNDIYDADLNIEHLYFDKDGLLTENADDIAFRIETVDTNINGNTQYKPEKIEVPAEYNQLASEKNILVFENGKLFSDSRFYMEDFGKNFFKYDTSDRNITNIAFKTFFYMKSNEYYGNITKIPNQKEVKNTVEKVVDANNVNAMKPVDKFTTPFNFKLYRSKSYEKNIAEAVAYIMSYDMNLLLQYYRQRSNIKSYVYTGAEVIDKAADGYGYITIPRTRRNGLDDFVIAFVDNELYEFNFAIEYHGKDFKIPIFDHVPRDSVLEILHFRNICNDNYTLTVDENVDDYIASELRYGNFSLFGNSPSGSTEYIDGVDFEKTNILYDLNFDYKNNIDANGKYKSTSIVLHDDYYYGKKITVASKRQFRYMYFIARRDTTIIPLSPDFRFAHYKNHYLIFVNGKRISFEQFELNIQVDQNKTDWNYITLHTQLVDLDKLEIFYLPDAYEELSSNVDKSKGYGDIYVDTSKLEYQFDKDLFMVFVDGYKINNNYLENIDSNRVRITNQTGTIDNVTVLKLMQPDELLSELFSYGDTWSYAVESLTPQDFEKLLLHNIKK